jgi:hypothetical protein
VQRSSAARPAKAAPSLISINPLSEKPVGDSSSKAMQVSPSPFSPVMPTPPAANKEDGSLDVSGLALQGSPEKRGAGSSRSASITRVTNSNRGSVDSNNKAATGSASVKDEHMQQIVRRLSQSLADQDSDRPASGGGGQRRAVRSTLRKGIVSRKIPESMIKRCARWTVENKYFVAFTTVLTIYALVGDDFRLLATSKPADVVFDFITLACLFVFFIEIVLACLGKNDYFMGFFFCLDVISTASLLLDLSWIADIMFGDGEDLDKLRSGRTARVGARAGRVVRVIRLVRILKLYKAIHEARAAQLAKQKNGEEDDWGDDEEGKRREPSTVKESRVGKRLSEMTTIRVIILVLTMLMVLPFLQVDSTADPPVSALYAADELYEAYSTYNASRTDLNKIRYENSVLRYMYYHNWYGGNAPDKYMPASYTSGPPDFQVHAFWLGIMSLDSGRRGFIESDANWAGLRVRPSTVTSFAANVRSKAATYEFGTMPAGAQAILGKTRWDTSCGVSNKGISRRGLSVLESDIEGQVGYVVKCPQDLRNFERLKYSPRTTTFDQYKQWHFAIYFDTRPLSKQDSLYSLITTGFICVVLCLASLGFSNDANRLVLRPVEKMINRVEIIRDDPLVAVQMADEEFKHEEKEKAKLRAQRSKRLYNTLHGYLQCNNCRAGVQEEAGIMETVILEKTIIKLGSLLALGFGEAGANIIGHNLESSESAGVNGMVPGERVEAIIGVARIREFSVATEVLKAKVMTFVNRIAEIVHGVVTEFHGAPNKNNGETFMLIWSISGKEDNMVSRIADFSCIAFAKILGAVHRSPLLATYRAHPAMQQRLGGNARVCLTFGLHAGWAIEGAVGSEFKIDASYLSPNVSIAVSVELATNTYQIPIIVTESVIDLCNPAIQAKFRKIDRVKIRGSIEPLHLHCLDLDYMSLSVDHDKKGRPNTWNSRLRFKARQFLEMEKIRKLSPDCSTIEMFDSCQDITKMRRHFSIEFLHLFNMGYANYFEGEWQVARRFLSDARTMLRAEDGPSAALLRFMESPHRFTAPANWKGVHDLVEH